MNRKTIFGAVCLMLCAIPALAGGIRGDYVETRSADVYTGPCFANGEVNLTGSEAVLAWHIREGEWNGIRLDGLSVVAIAKARATLGDPYRNPYPAESVLILDRRGSDEQQKALAALAHALAGPLLDHVVAVHTAPIRADFRVDGEHCAALVEAGDLATIRTRGIGDKDHLCGNETAYYPPLAELDHVMPAVALANEYVGNELGSEWRIFNKRSAFVGSFAR